MIGIEQVAALEIEGAGTRLISRTYTPDYRQRKVGEYYIRMGHSPEDMKVILDRIAVPLEMVLYAELIESGEND